MSHDDVSISVSTGGEGETLVTVSGELDLATAPTLRDTLVDLVGQRRPELLVLDLQGVTFMDSTAIGVIVGAKKRQTAGGGHFTVITNALVHRLLLLTGLDGFLDLREPS